MSVPSSKIPGESSGLLWEDALAEQVVEARDARGIDPTLPIVCASGISPSGPIHLGNLREVFTTHLVAEALRRRGEEVVHLHSWDDYDRFRKVPAGVDPSFERFIGRPLAELPDPFGDPERSYAEHFMDEFRLALDRLGIGLTERRQSELYPAGTYNAGIRTALDERGRIFDVLAGQQTAGRHERSAVERRREYFPFKPYCTECRRDDTRVTGWDPAAASVAWECRHGHGGEMSLADGARVSGKLVWKVDWPMRWAHERVLFEPAGEDHHAPTASFTVGRTFVDELYAWTAPETTVYSFVTLAGMTGKMSGSVGGAPIPSTALDVLEPAVLRWLYVRRLPAQSFQIDLAPRGVQRLYDEWDRFGAAAGPPGSAGDGDAAILDEATRTHLGPVALTPRPVSFRLLASVADLTQGEETQIARIVSAEFGLPPGDPAAEPRHLLPELRPRLDCAVHLATEIVPEAERTRVRVAHAPEVLAALDADARRGVELLAGRLGEDWSLTGLTALVYAIPKELHGLAPDAEPTAELKRAQRAFFRDIYRLLVDADTGPRLPTLLLSIGLDRSRALLVGDGG